MCNDSNVLFHGAISECHSELLLVVSLYHLVCCKNDHLMGNRNCYQEHGGEVKKSVFTPIIRLFAADDK